MTCPNCNATLPETDRFCEECGAQLLDLSTHSAGTGCQCGAACETDEDGYCTGCGVRREAPARDHFEVEISPRFAGVSDRGIRHHRNEDCFDLLQDSAHSFSIVVCDGVSSTEDPDRASEAACGAALAAIADGAGLSPERRLLSAMSAAQTAVKKLGSGSNNAPATTIVCAIATSDRVTLSWLGDSRACWVADSRAVQLTTDHSWLNEVVAAGEFTEEAAAQHGNAHAITRWLGADAPEDSKPPVLQFEITEPGRLLICTDGLWNYTPEIRILADLVRSSGKDALTTARNLVRFANAQGGHDNITAALLFL